MEPDPRMFAGPMAPFAPSALPQLQPEETEAEKQRRMLLELLSAKQPEIMREPAADRAWLQAAISGAVDPARIQGADRPFGETQTLGELGLSPELDKTISQAAVLQAAPIPPAPVDAGPEPVAFAETLEPREELNIKAMQAETPTGESRWMAALKAATPGLQQLGQGMGLYGANIRPIEFENRGLREDEDQRRFLESAEGDPRSPLMQQTRESLKKLGIDLPAGMNYAQFKKALPALKMQIAASQAPAGKPLATVELEKISAGERSIKNLTEISNELGKFESAIGPLQARGGKVMEFFGWANPERAGFRAKVERVLNRYIKEMTGAQMSAKEAKRLLASMQRPTDSDKVFAEKLRGVLKEAKQNHEMTIDAYRRAGRDVSGFSYSAGGDQGYRVPGRAKPVYPPEEEIEEFLQEFPNAERL